MSQVHDWVVYKLGVLFGSVGHEVKIHTITPATEKNRGVILRIPYWSTYVHKVFRCPSPDPDGSLRKKVGLRFGITSSDQIYDDFIRLIF